MSRTTIAGDYGLGRYEHTSNAATDAEMPLEI